MIQVNKLKDGLIQVRNSDKSTEFMTFSASFDICADSKLGIVEINSKQRNYKVVEHFSKYEVNGQTYGTIEELCMALTFVNFSTAGSASASNTPYFEKEEDLLIKYPHPSLGDTAWVGTPYPGTVYNVVDGQWSNTGDVPPTPQVDINNWEKTDF